jgi:hypothetical protein
LAQDLGESAPVTGIQMLGSEGLVSRVVSSVHHLNEKRQIYNSVYKI